MGKPSDMPSTGSTKVAAALGTFALLLFLFTQPMAATPSQPRIRVLILDGFSNHDWHQTTALLRGILEPLGLFTVSVSTAPPTAASPGWEQWRPNLAITTLSFKPAMTSAAALPGRLKSRLLLKTMSGTVAEFWFSTPAIMRSPTGTPTTR